mmetsp:Transcript_32338/g.77341  ORF Transcript_32338/g.77341 Transcript_32338/m.77341 type:complete len:216 (+) Transcript_32338:1444-2091(+)
MVHAPQCHYLDIVARVYAELHRFAALCLSHQTGVEHAKGDQLRLVLGAARRGGAGDELVTEGPPALYGHGGQILSRLALHPDHDILPGLEVRMLPPRVLRVRSPGLVRQDVPLAVQPGARKVHAPGVRELPIKDCDLDVGRPEERRSEMPGGVHQGVHVGVERSELSGGLLHWVAQLLGERRLPKQAVDVRSPHGSRSDQLLQRDGGRLTVDRRK